MKMRKTKKNVSTTQKKWKKERKKEKLIKSHERFLVQESVGSAGLF